MDNDIWQLRFNRRSGMDIYVPSSPSCSPRPVPLHNPICCYQFQRGVSVGGFKNSEEAGDSARRTHLLKVVTEQNQSSTISESVRPLSLSESVHPLSFRHNLHLTFNYHPGSQAFSTTAISAYLQSVQSELECIINYPDENKTLCSTPPTTNQWFRRHNYKCEGGFPASTPSTTNQRFRRHYHKCEGGPSAYYQSLDCTTEVHMASSFQADQTPIHDLTSSTAHTMSTSSASTLLFQSIGLTNRRIERLVTSPSADNMNICYAYDDYTTYWTSKSPSDLIPRTHTADLITLPVYATVYVLHSNHEDTFSSVTCFTQSPYNNMLGKTASEFGEDTTSMVDWVRNFP